jgi:hypothetical protein
MKVFWWTVFAMNMLAVIVTGLVTLGWWLASALPRSL